MTMAGPSLADRHILLVEDDYFIAEEMVTAFVRAGALIVGPVASAPEALVLAAQAPVLDGAVLDINLRGQTSFPIADVLADRGVPYIFVSGYERSIIPARHAHVKSCEKPVDSMVIAAALFG